MTHLTQEHGVDANRTSASSLAHWIWHGQSWADVSEKTAQLFDEIQFSKVASRWTTESDSSLFSWKSSFPYSGGMPSVFLLWPTPLPVGKVILQAQLPLGLKSTSASLQSMEQTHDPIGKRCKLSNTPTQHTFQTLSSASLS